MLNKNIVVLRSNPVDPDSRVEKEVNSLIKMGHEITILAWDRNNKYKLKESYLELNLGKVRIIRFGIPAVYGGGIKSNLNGLIKFQIKLFTWLYKNRDSYQIIHACDFDTAFTAYRIAKLLKKKLIYDIFDYYIDAFHVPKIINGLVKNKDHEIINSADAVIICTEKRKEQITGTCPKRLVVIHNTPPLIQIKETKRVSLSKSNKIKIVYVGILGEGRLIIEIANVISKRNNCEFHIGGFGYLDKDLIKISDRYSNIKFYGKLSYPETLYLESQCDIMTAIYDPKHPNHKYAAPNKFYEALMLGKPLIVAKRTGIDDIVLSENIGEVIEYDEKSFEVALDRLIAHQQEWSIISKKFKEIYDKYSWDKMEERLHELYDAVLSE